jgi:uroporphyrinogen-III synthase
MKKVLSTKTLDKDTITYAKALNLEIQCMDFIETNALTFDTFAIAAQPVDGFVFTSANAVRYFFEKTDAPQFLKDRKVFALAGKTSEELRKREIIAASSAGNASELADVIIKTGEAKSVVHVCGNLKLNVLESKLQTAGIRYTPLFVYETVLNRVEKIQQKFDAVLFFSPSGVESFFATNDIASTTVCCCIGHSTADALKHNRSGLKIILPLQPSAEAMINELDQYFKGQSN